MPTIQGTERKTGRLEAFSDAVLAIAITLPLVAIHVPRGQTPGHLAQDYARLGADAAAYAIGATVIGLYWAHSHFSGKIVEKTDHGFNLLTLLFLVAVSAVPLPALPLVEHLRGDADSPAAAAVFCWTLVAPSTLWLIRWIYAERRGLPDPRLTPAYTARLTIKYAVMTAGFWLAALVSLWAWRWGLGITALLVLSYVAPPMSPEFKTGEEPAHELEEADERPRDGD